MSQEEMDRLAYKVSIIMFKGVSSLDIFNKESYALSVFDLKDFLKSPMIGLVEGFPRLPRDYGEVRRRR